MNLIAKASSVVRPHPGFESCGDAVLCLEPDGAQLFVVIDALGHGPDAAQSATRAREVIHGLVSPALGELFDMVDRGLAGLREVVMSALRVERGTVRFAGVGNVELFGPPEVSRPAPQVGRVGRGLRPLRESILPVSAGQRWALASDGLRHREMRRALDQTRRLPLVEAAANLLELVGRDDDDASVLLVDFDEVRP